MKLFTKLQELSLVVLLRLFLSFIVLSGCSMYPLDPVDKRASAEKSLYHFKSDSTIRLSTGSNLYPGMIATNLDGPLTFTVTSKIKFTYAIIETCHRDIVVRVQKNNTLTHTINFLPVELSCKSAIIIQMFGENGETDWALIAIRTDEDLQTENLSLECNGVRWTFKGYSTCNHKMGKKQVISFPVPIKSFRSEERCNIKRINEKSFELRPGLGECISVFTDGKRWHTALFIGFEREFIR